MRTQSPCFSSVVLLVVLLVASQDLSAEPLRFAFVPKVGGDFFQITGNGCQDAAAALADVECRYLPPDKADARLQDNVIRSALARGVDGIAVAAIASDFLMSNSLAEAKRRGVPVVTFDADMASDTFAVDEFRAAFVGTDNLEFGKALGGAVLRFRPNGGKLAVISGNRLAHNLQDRLRGVRSALAGVDYQSTEQRPTGENGWYEYDRSPLFSDDDTHRAQNLLAHYLRTYQQRPDLIDTIVVLGEWAQVIKARYIELLAPFKEDLKDGRLVVVHGDLSALQIELLDGYATANVGQNPYQMGYIAVQLLSQLSKGESVPRTQSTPFIECLSTELSDCRKRVR